MNKKNIHAVGILFIKYSKQQPNHLKLILAMKLFIILLAFTTQVSAAFSQKIRVQKTNAKLEDVIKLVCDQSNHAYMFSSDVYKIGKPVTIDIASNDIREVLDAIFKDQPFTYTISKDGTVRVSIRKPEEKKPAPAVEEPDPPVRIKGRVTDMKNQPLIGVNVVIKNSNRGGVTDTNGEFSLLVPFNSNNQEILMFSYIGFEKKEVKITPETTNLFITLLESSEQLRTVVISTGYQKISPEKFVGSAVYVDSTIIKRGTSPDLISRLDGMVNGLLFNKSAGNLRLQVRGVNTIGGGIDIAGRSNYNPLIILDDFPYNGNLNNINPNEIENITILKDAAATSIWGARAANGVLVITSKAGSLNKKTSVNFSSNVMYSQKPDLNYFPRMSSSDFIEVEKFLFGKGFYNFLIGFPQFGVYTPVVETLKQQRLGVITESEANKRIAELGNHNVMDDYKKYVLRNAVNVQNYLNISGGSNNVGYNLSIGSDNNNTSIKGPGSYDRYTINSDLILKPLKPLQITAGINYSNETSLTDGPGYNIIPGGGRTQIYPYARLADENGNPLSIPKDFVKSFIDTVGGGKLLNWNYIPLEENKLVNYRTNTQLFQFNFGGQYNFLSWLNLSLKYQYGKQMVNERQLIDKDAYYARDLVNRYTDPSTLVRAIPIGGILDQAFSNMTNQNFRSQVNINYDWSKVHEITGLMVAEIGTVELKQNGNRIYGYDESNLTYSSTVDYSNYYQQFFGGTAMIPNNLRLVDRSDRFASFLANASYTYAGKYSIYASGRKDGSNILGTRTNNKWKPLWSVGIRWDISDESFYKISWLNNLSFRVSYGYSGNVNNSITALTTISYFPIKNIYDQPMSTISNIANPDLRWEELRTLNFGVNWSMLNRRITGAFDYYRKKAKDLISNVNVDQTVGVPSVTKNAASLKGHGLELQLTTRNLIGKLKWTTTLNHSFARTMVDDFYGTETITPLGASIRKGELFGSLYAYKWAGLDPENGDPRGYLKGEISKNYRAIAVDSASNQAYIGSSFPLYFGNLLNRFGYKNFELSFNIIYRGNYYFRKPSLRYDNLYVGWVGHKDYEKRWKQKGDENSTNVPSMPYPANVQREKFYAFSEANIERGDNIRLQDVRLSYTWGNSRRTKFPIKNAEIYLYANNLNVFIWKATKSGYDPDYLTNVIPPLRNYSLGIRLGL
uniref:SusC/RagA family TonB-linked outer membrane protein n=1 Tax=Pedobacter schmidteae TaxID=2201271 RepID=UPI000EAC2056|nr:SusC/RagA family TonB-linked outer membrane protein [Pedobacter schmidteae]